jgi:hypothetical protein
MIGDNKREKLDGHFKSITLGDNSTKKVIT